MEKTDLESKPIPDPDAGRGGADSVPAQSGAPVPAVEALVFAEEEMGMAELLAKHESSGELNVPETQSIFMAKVVSVIGDGVLVDIGDKKEAMIPRREFGREVSVAAGETIPVLVLPGARGDGSVRVSWKAAQERMAWEHLAQSADRRLPLRAVVRTETKGGLLVECERVLLGFMPASQVDVRPVKDLKLWRGKEISCYVMESDPRKNRLVLSRRLWLSEENQKKKAETLSQLKVGDVRAGVVTGITSFGAFVDLGGVEGLLHIGELEWARTPKISQILKVGQTIEVKVIRLDPESEKISLSRKELLPHPWEGVETRFPVGTLVPGRIVSITDFGAFVELSPGVEGLLHASEISWKGNGQKPSDLLKVNQKIEVKVLSFNREKEKISLSLKRARENPWQTLAEKYPEGSVAKVTVSSLAGFGAFARLPEGLEGLIHVSDFSWTQRIRHPEDVVKVGQELEVKVLEIDAKKEKISFGVKQLQRNPFDSYSKGMRVRAVVKDVTERGAVVTLEPGVEGFVAISEISMERHEKPSDVLKPGEAVEAKVVSVDTKERRLQLSIRQLDRELQKAAAKKYSGHAPRPNLGDLLDS